jgi:hypothetical protein
MPASERSLLLTDVYRARLNDLRDRLALAAQRGWNVRIDRLDESFQEWLNRVVPVTRTMNALAGRFALAYLGQFIAAETGRPAPAPPAVDMPAVENARDGRPLAEAFRSPLIRILVALKDGQQPDEAIMHGFNAAMRIVPEEPAAQARETLAATIQQDDRIIGWRRVTAGGCLACVAASDVTYGDAEPLLVHDGCQCTAEPIVRGVRDRVSRPAGRELFDSLSPGEQDARYGDAARVLRAGDVPLKDLIEVNRMAVIPDQLTQAPVAAL